MFNDQRQYVHTTPTTTFMIPTTTYKTKGMKVKISGNIKGKVELNQNTISVCRLSQEHISGMAYGFKVELSGNAEGDDQLTKRQYVHATTCTTTLTTTTASIMIAAKAKRI